MDYQAAKAFIVDKMQRELSQRLTYHGLHHTLDVLEVTSELCALENIPPADTLLLETAALFHDCGFTVNNKNHEELGCDIARAHLPRFGFSPTDINRICGMIMATKIPQRPQDRFEEILCDADLDYLGRPDFYAIGATLFEELKAFNVLHTEEAWNRLQVNFLENHQFFTATNRKRREPVKASYLRELKILVATYNPR